MKISLKKILPKRILPRLLTIFFVPLLCTQILGIYLFYEKHYEKVTTRFSNIASNQINFIVSEYKKNGYKSIDELARSLNIIVNINANEPLRNYDYINLNFVKKKIINTFNNRLNEKFSISFQEDEIIINIYLINSTLKFIYPKKYLISQTPIIFFLWLILSSLLLSFIAFLFLRIQVRAITRLADFSNKLPFSKNNKSFKSEGAVEIRMAGNAIIRMKRRIKNDLKQRTQFLAGISHDLGTILTRIRLQLEMVSKLSDIKKIKSDVSSMQSLLREYLEFSKNIDTTIKISKFDIKPFLQKIIINLNKSFPKVKTKLICNSDINVFLSQSNLYRVVSNLLHNAFKFSNKIHVTVKVKETFIIVSIEDNGKGIMKSDRIKIFRPFYKLDKSRNLNSAGSGLGLSIAKEIITKMGGTINVEQSSLKGASFKITIPKTQKA